jgi:hypothetical protein
MVYKAVKNQRWFGENMIRNLRMELCSEYTFGGLALGAIGIAAGISVYLDLEWGGPVGVSVSPALQQENYTQLLLNLCLRSS